MAKYSTESPRILRALWNRGRIVDRNPGAPSKETLDRDETRGLPHIVRIRLECEAPDGEAVPRELVSESLDDTLEDPALLRLVRLLDRVEER